MRESPPGTNGQWTSASNSGGETSARRIPSTIGKAATIPATATGAMPWAGPGRSAGTANGGRSFDYLHMALPIAKVLDYRRRCEEILAARGVRVVEYAIWSRPELFSMMVAPVDNSGDGEDSRKNLAEAVEEVLILAQDLGGVMEYCHGVGMKLNHLLAREMGVGHDVMRELKRTLDPANIMNPGKLGL